ncbi:MAG: hypothetical protein IT556_01110, partial [Acetobacteraceae bacterium]|nr:hypothetical protein [Acetobacteraceae bacterium]
MAGDVTCVLTVDRDGGVLLTQGEASYLGKVRHDARTGLIVERLDRFVNHHPGGATGCEKIDLELLGAVLFDILLGGQATRLPNYRAGERNDHPLDQTLGQLVAQWVRSTGDDGRFRLSLRFEDERSPLATYPWECLFVGQPDSAD